MVSDLEKNGLICLKNCFGKKVQFQVFKFYVFLLFCTFLQGNFMDWYRILPQIWDHIFKTVFLKHFFLFYIQSSKLSINMRKLCMKLRNGTIYHSWGPICKNSFFQKRTPPSSKMLDLHRRWHLKRIDEKIQGYF